MKSVTAGSGNMFTSFIGQYTAIIRIDPHSGIFVYCGENAIERSASFLIKARAIRQHDYHKERMWNPEAVRLTQFSLFLIFI